MSQITYNTPTGTEFAGKPKKVSWERLWTFSGGNFSLTGWPRKNLHTDLEFAKSCGLPSVGASATQFMGYVAQLMIELFGVEWLSHGTMDSKFLALVDSGDTLIAKAVLKSKEIEDQTVKFFLDTWCENQRGQKVLVGSATGMLKK
jgi:acyl dehydratase